MELNNFVKTYDDCDCNGPFYVQEPRKFFTQYYTPKTRLLGNSKGKFNHDKFSLSLSSFLLFLDSRSSFEISVLASKCHRFPHLNKMKVTEKLILSFLALYSLINGLCFLQYAKLQFNELSHSDCFVYTSHYH